MYTFDQYFWLEITNSYTIKQWIIFWISTFCVNCVCNDILLMNTTYRPSIFSVLLQLKQYETRQNCWPRWMCSTSFFEKTSTVTYCVINLLNSALTFLAIYVNKNKYIENKTTTEYVFKWTMLD